MDWLNQKVGQASNFIRQTAGNVSKGADWLNQNIVKPGSKLARDFGANNVAEVLDNVGSAGQAVSNIGKMVNKGSIYGKDLKRSADEIGDSVRRGVKAASKIKKPRF